MRVRGCVPALLCGAVLLVMGAPSTLHAQPSGATAAEHGGGDAAPDSDRSASFRAAEGARPQDVPGGPLLLAAYGVAWLFLLMFVVRLARLQSATARELERLERIVASQDAKDRAQET